MPYSGCSPEGILLWLRLSFVKDLAAQLEEKKVKLSDVRVTANTLKSTYPHIDNQALSDLVADVRPKLHEVSY